MNAIAVLVLLLFFIALALSLTVWAGLSLGTRRRAERALAAERLLAERPARARAPLAAPTPPAPGPSADPTTHAPVVREGRAGRREAPPRPARAAGELPWLRPAEARDDAPEWPRPPLREGPAHPAGSTVPEPRMGPPRVVVTETSTPPGAVDDRRGQRAGGELLGNDAERGPTRATVTERQVEKDAFDRFLDAERLRD